MRRSEGEILLQHPLYVERIKGHLTWHKGYTFGYFKKGGRYNVVLTSAGAIIGTAKRLDEVESLIIEFISSTPDLDAAIYGAQMSGKLWYEDWVELGRDISDEICIPIQFAIINDEVSYIRLIQYLMDDLVFKEELEDGTEINEAMIKTFGADVHKMICEYCNMNGGIYDNGL